MKRSMGQKVASQEGSSKMSRHDLEDVKKAETPTTNGFLVETVLRRLFKIIESVSVLKVLRRMCQLWDRVDTEELEERAFQGLFKPINLTFFNQVSREFNPLKASILEMRGFLDDTSSNPRLFRSFAINFPCSITVLNLHKFRWFYTEYSPTYLELDIPKTFRFNHDKELLLKELLRWAAPTLRELAIHNTYGTESDQIPTRKSLPVQSLYFPHLRKVSTRIYMSNGVVEAFKVIFAKGQTHPATPSLTSLSLRSVFPLDLLDLNSSPSRWATLTKLDIFYGHILCGDDGDNGANNYERFNQFTHGLMSLARAGMTLKKLDLGLRLVKNPFEDEEDPHFFETFRNLSQFFESQADSLQALKLTFELKVKVPFEEGQIKIQLPVFKRLYTLSLDLETLVFYTNGFSTRNIFDFGSISQHFPALENLAILKYGSFVPFWGDSVEEAERMNLKRIKIPNGIFWGSDVDFSKNFGSVVAFCCLQGALNDLGMLGDLVDTIQVLHIRDVNSDLDLSQFKGLRRVVIEENDSAICNLDQKKLKDHEGDYLSYFQNVAELGLDSIMFRGLEMIEGESYKEFAQAFPFRVEFEDKPVDWFDEDFIDN